MCLFSLQRVAKRRVKATYNERAFQRVHNDTWGKMAPGPYRMNLKMLRLLGTFGLLLQAELGSSKVLGSNTTAPRK